MRFTAYSAFLLALAQYVSALPAGTDKTSALHVTLSQIGDTKIKAVVQNTGAEEITFLHLNFFKDHAPVKKVAVYRNGIMHSYPAYNSPYSHVF